MTRFLLWTEALSMRWQWIVLAAALAGFTFGNAWMSIQTTPFGVAPDEWAHATYIHEVAAEGRLIPNYGTSRILPDRARGNYLNHPPLYYTTLGLTGRLLGWDAVSDYRNYRAVSAAMVAAGLFMWVLTGLRLGIPVTWVIAITAATNAIPMLPFLAGSINNDNLAYLGVAIFFYGLVHLRDAPRAAYYIAAAGLAIAFLSKATAALFLCIFFLFWALPQVRDPASPIRNRHFMLATACAGLVTGVYFALALYKHGTPFPNSSILYPENPPSDPLALAPFAAEFGRQMIGRLPMITSHASLAPLAGKWQWLFWPMLAIPLFAWLVTRRWQHGAEYLVIGRAFMLALAGVVLAHLLVVWNAYMTAGVFAGMQPRYYSYVLPGFFIFCFLHCTGRRFGHVLFGSFAFPAAVLLGVAPSLATRAQVEARIAASMAPSKAEPMRYPSATPASPSLTARLSFSTLQVGFLDSVEVANGSASASGWAINRKDLAPARSVMVIVGERIIGSIDTGAPRPDVASALKSNRAGSSGFRVRIDNLPPETDACDFRFAAVQSDGSLALLVNAPCRRQAK